jgi:hypothetical protein
MYLRLGVLLLAASAAAVCPVGSSIGQSDVHRHSGQVVSFDDGEALPAAVRAWSAGTTIAGREVCTTHSPAPLDAVDADASTGEFELAIPSGDRLFTFAVCADSYIPYIQYNAPNRSSSGVLVPKPIQLWLADQSVEGSEEYFNRVAETVTAALNELTYLRSLDPEAFDRAIEDQASAIATHDEKSALLFREFAVAGHSWAFAFAPR